MNDSAFPSPPVSQLKGVGPKTRERLARLGIHDVRDLLFHLPLRYQDRSRVWPLGSLRPGDQATIEVEVVRAELRPGRRRSLRVEVADDSGSLWLRLFHFSAAQQAALAPGKRLRCFGEARQGPGGLEMVHPEYRAADEPAPVADDSLTPIYPTTEGLHQLTWMHLSAQALEWLETNPEGLREWLPAELLGESGLPSLADAVRFLHRPPLEASLEALERGAHPAQRRLAFEELLAHQLSLRKARQLKQRQQAPVLQGDELLTRLFAALPFRPTAAQRRVIDEIARDIARPRPMLRLVQGDVGSGKTLVALAVGLIAIDAGYQVALMAPTELLARQHLATISAWLEPLGVPVDWLAGRHKGRRRDEKLDALAGGAVRFAIGTHALFQDDVRFERLGLVIVDEQHRFGVHQRLALREKGRHEDACAHQLIMTATPIPRTLAMTAYADLDVSVIDELPPGRKPVTTVAIGDDRRAEVVARVEAAIAAGRQAYWVCTLIEESEALQCQTAEETVTRLREELPARRIGLVHGRMKGAEKETVMRAFQNGELDLLVATTVIEVGVDVPNASLMIIENPERLGLAQLHQLRGRVGRGEADSYCVLLYQRPLGQQARERLNTLRETNDGFVIAEKDLALRGAGELLGTRQTGEVSFRIADLARDAGLLPRAQETADRLLRDYPGHVEPLIRRWIAHPDDYVSV